MSDASSAACADAPALVDGVAASRCARCCSFWLAIARTCGMSARRGERHQTLDDDALHGARDLGFVRARARGAECRRQQLIDHRLESRQRRVERVLLDQPRRARVGEEKAEGHV